MILSRTPYRISFFGGGTDYPSWFLQDGGSVLSTTVDKFCYISCRYLPPFFEGTRHRIVWSHIETVSTISEILHPAVRYGMRYLGFDDSVGLEIHHQGDLPARAGMGSSSAFAVGLIRALLALRGQCVTKQDLAKKAIELEQDVMRENVGCQDQIAAAYGGLNIVRFCSNGEFRVEPLTIAPERRAELQRHLLLFYTGTSRLASEIAADVVANIPQRAACLRKMQDMVDRGAAILTSGHSLDDFGALLHDGWMLKKELSRLVTNTHVDTLYATALDRGALGGKLLGAGASGFMVMYVPPERQEAVISALSRCLHVPFHFESEGSTLLHYDPNDSARRAP